MNATVNLREGLSLADRPPSRVVRPPVTRGRFEPEESGAVEALSSDVADAIKVLPGFVAYQSGNDRNTGTMVAISSWEDRSSAEFPRDKLGDVLRRVTEVTQLEPAEIYEVMVTA